MSQTTKIILIVSSFALIILGSAVFLGVLAYRAYALGPGRMASFYQHNSCGNDAYERGDYVTAEQEYGQMITDQPHREDGYVLRGMAEYRAHHFSAAVADDTRGLALMSEPKVRAAVRVRRAYASRVTQSQAIRQSIADLHFNRARAYEGKDAHVEAIADYTAVLRLMPQDWDAYEGRMELEYGAKQYAQAVADGTVVLAHRNPNARDYKLRAMSEAAVGKDGAARTDFLSALAMEPGMLEADSGLAEMDVKEGRPADGAALWAKATAANPGNAGAWGGRGWYDYLSGDTEAAITNTKTAIALDGSQAWLHYNLGLYYAVQGEQAQSLAEYTAAPPGPEKDRKACIEDVRHALAKNPDSAALQQALRQFGN